jgi:hypothetical protein
MTKLTPEEIRFFRDEGFLIKRGITDESLTAQARERLWENAPPGIDPNNPDTWVGPIQEYREKNNEKGNDGGGYGWWYRGIGSKEWMVRMLVIHPPIWEIVEQMLGEEDVVRPNSVRGIYCRLPEGNVPCKPLSCHTDAHAFHLGVVGYIDDVAPNGGGFSVWPRSHRVFYYTHQTRHLRDQSEQYLKNRAYFNHRSPIDCHGRAGDVVFWHHRLAHSAGSNRSKGIRKAVLGDYVKKDIERTMNEPPCEDMWEDWPGIPSNGKP